MQEAAVRFCRSCAGVYDDPSLAACPEDGGPLLPVPTSDGLIGRVVADRYEVRACIGQGGMGTVYLARQLAMERDVALKVLKPELATDRRFRARFAREARSASRIQSVRVVTMIDHGDTKDGLLYIAMELLEGKSLADALSAEGRIAPFEAVRIAMEVARALDAAHAAGVVHRDLKPENVYITERERAVKVLDFGIAKVLAPDVPGDEGPGATASGTVLGTPAYVSPETVAGGSSATGPPADLYALGVLLFEMLTGRRPFESTSSLLLMEMHRRQPPPKLREVAPELPYVQQLEAVIGDLLEKNPERRPTAIAAVARLEDLAAQLAMLGEGEVSAVISGSFRAQTRTEIDASPPARRAPIVLVLAVLGLAVLVGSSLAAAWVLTRGGEPSATPARVARLPEAAPAPPRAEPAAPVVAEQAPAVATEPAVEPVHDAGAPVPPRAAVEAARRRAPPRPRALPPRSAPLRGDPLRTRVQIE